MTITPHHHQDDTEPRADRLARRCTRGTLLIGDHHPTVRFVRDHRDGAFVFRLPRAELADAREATLMLPDDSHECEVAVHLSLAEMPCSGERAVELADEIAQDRFFAYHETRDAGVWVRATAIGAKLSDASVEPGEALSRLDPLADAQGRVCKRLNSDRAALACVCSNRLGVELPDPLAVGVDRFGIDVRGEFRCARLEFDAPADDEAGAMRVIDSWMNEVESGPAR